MRKYIKRTEKKTENGQWSIDYYQDGGIYCRRPNESMDWHNNDPDYYCADGKRRED